MYDYVVVAGTDTIIPLNNYVFDNQEGLDPNPSLIIKLKSLFF